MMQLVLAAFVAAGEMTASEADAVHQALRFEPVGQTPGVVLGQIRTALAQVRQPNQKTVIVEVK